MHRFEVGRLPIADLYIKTALSEAFQQRIRNG
jgi:hypothetical protein